MGSKCYTQKFFVIDNLRHEALLGLDFLRKAKVEIDLRNYVLRHGSNAREVVYLDEPPEVMVGSVTDPRTQFTAYARYDLDVEKEGMMNMPVRPSLSLHLEITKSPASICLDGPRAAPMDCGAMGLSLCGQGNPHFFEALMSARTLCTFARAMPLGLSFPLLVSPPRAI